MRTKIYFVVVCLMGSWFLNAQSALQGYTGLINVPTANLNNDGTVVIGAGYTPASYAVLEPNENGELSYYVNLTFLPFMEMVLGATLPSNAQGSWGIGDRKGLIRLQILKEREETWRPNILIGFHDPFNSTKAVYGSRSNQNFNTNYLVVSKKILFHKNFSFDTTLGYGISLKEAENSQLKGIFGGVSFNYKDRILTILEYDTENLNCGLKIKVFKSLYFTTALLDMKIFTGGINLIFKL